MSNVFAVIQLILAALSMWEGFLDWLAVRHLTEITERAARLNQAIDDATKATTPDEAWDAQTDIVDNEP